MTGIPATSRSEYVRQAMRYANTILRHRWIIIALPLIAGSISVARSLMRARTYTAQAKFMTQGPSRPQNTGLAAQLGVNLGTAGDASLSPDFYSDLLTSRPVVEGVVHASYTLDQKDTLKRQTLVELYHGEEAAVNIVRGGIGTGIAQKTGVVTVSARAATPYLAVQIAQQLLRQLDQFNRERRKSRITAERQFTQARLVEAAQELRTAENSLTDFLTRNHGFERSPELTFAQERLAREVTRRQQLYASLAQSFEQSKIDEVRDTPVITVLEEPRMPLIGDSRHTLDRGLLAIVLGLLLAIGIAFVLEFVKGTHVRTTDEFSEFRSHGRDFLREVRNPLGSAKRLFS